MDTDIDPARMPGIKFKGNRAKIKGSAFGFRMFERIQIEIKVIGVGLAEKKQSN